MLRAKKEMELGNYVTKRAKFARICIEVDLNMVFPLQFELNSRVYSAKYEEL